MNETITINIGNQFFYFCALFAGRLIASFLLGYKEIARKLGQETKVYLTNRLARYLIGPEATLAGLWISCGDRIVDRIVGWNLDRRINRQSKPANCSLCNDTGIRRIPVRKTIRTKYISMPCPCKSTSHWNGRLQEIRKG